MKYAYIKAVVETPEKAYLCKPKLVGVGCYSMFYIKDLDYLQKERKLRLPYCLIRKAANRYHKKDVCFTFLDEGGHVRIAFSNSSHALRFDYFCDLYNKPIWEE